MTAVVITELERCIIDRLREMPDENYRLGVCKMVGAPATCPHAWLKDETEEETQNRYKMELNNYHAAGYKGKPAFGTGPVQMIMRKLDGEEK